MGSARSLKIPDQNEINLRFHVVVFNFERIESFLNHFAKIKNFRPKRDRIVILDCSVNHASQKRQVEQFARQHGWTLGKEVQFVRRKNWGIDQGARVDYFSWLHQARNAPAYIWQFQEHYLDLESPYSVWEKEKPELGGTIKADTIPDNLKLDLDHCEHIYQSNSQASVIFAARAKLGIFTHADGQQWFYADGANFSVRSAHAREVFPPNVLQSYKAVYDGSYQWTLFMELEFCRRLNASGRQWHDLVTDQEFDSPVALRNIEDKTQQSLHQTAESFYGPLYNGYERRFLAALNQSSVFRDLKVLRSFWYVRLRASTWAEGSRHNLKAMGLDTIGKRTLHYLAGVRPEKQK